MSKITYEILGVSFNISKIGTRSIYTATSKDMPSVYMAHPELNKIIDDLPNVVALYRSRNAATEV